jgi:hypothetical protein
MSHAALIQQFAKASLKLKISDKPIRGNGQIFEMDIQREFSGNRRSEYFRIYPGHEDNRIEVVGTDKQIGQLVLMVHEPRRAFVDTVWGDADRATFLKEHPALKPTDVLGVVGGQKKHTQYRVRQFTSPLKRHYLAGVDERQLFIAQLTIGCSTVREAHASLKSPTVTFAEGRAPGRTVRQGEWFFVNPTPEELRILKTMIKKNQAVVEKKVPIGAMESETRGPKRRQPSGNPHTADEAVAISGATLEHGFTVRGRREIYVRGKVRHVDHATVSFAEWRKVIRNQEANGAASGIGWID